MEQAETERDGQRLQGHRHSIKDKSLSATGRQPCKGHKMRCGPIDCPKDPLLYTTHTLKAQSYCRPSFAFLYIVTLNVLSQFLAKCKANAQVTAYFLAAFERAFAILHCPSEVSAT
ncbi:hypothetical protein RvY_17528 [Ramazzottius varieornatus]|uniref:Uncharacterized protein n=1 Tax=Ramazzottius varieornatus TaxID=947166 RepID=A0A1D1W2S0_RAMVA|nr:hypothetical protein RvY_17528 [Ramazzottius varieornatus]